MSDINKTYRLPNNTVATLKMKSASKLLQDAGLDKKGALQAFHTNNVLRRILKYWAYRTGMTNKVIIAQTDINTPEIIADTPYADILFFGKNAKGNIKYSKTKHPLAGARPDKALEAAEGAAITADLSREIKRRKAFE